MESFDLERGEHEREMQEGRCAQINFHERMREAIARTDENIAVRIQQAGVLYL